MADRRKWVKYTDKYPRIEGMGHPNVDQGQHVRIPKDVYVTSTRPKGDFITVRAQVVKINHILPGIARNVFARDPKGIDLGVPPKVVWAGSGGYWCEVDVNDIEVEDDNG